MGFTKQGNSILRIMSCSEKILFEEITIESAHGNPSFFNSLLHSNLLNVKAETLALQEVYGKDILSISLDRVASVVSRFGEIIYP